MAAKYLHYTYDQLNTFCMDAFQKFGFSESEARIISDVLLLSDLYGIESHGMQRLVRYHKGIEKGMIDVHAKPEIVHETPVSAVIDAHDAMGQLDVLYMTRIQQERFFNEEDYLRLKGCYQLDEKMLEQAPSSMPVLHPLPRIDEIAPDVDNDPRAAYFDQVHNGVYIRMAIILALLGIPDPLTGKKVLQD